LLKCSMKQLYHGCQDISKAFDFLWEKSRSIGKIVEYGEKSRGIGKIMEYDKKSRGIGKKSWGLRKNQIVSKTAFT
uniref:hypothetical protein n=1 Tax=Bacteroides congonensis TaxID=1871006 RepID=UPI002D7E2FAD